MVKKSLFARLFGRAGENGTSVTERRGGLQTADRRAADLARDIDASLEELEAIETAPDDAGADGDADAEAGNGAAHRVASNGRRGEELQPDPGPPVQALEMERAEETEMRLREGIQGISNLLTGIDRKIDRQQQRSDELMVTVKKIPEMMKDVPDASRAGLELLATISTILDDHGRATREIADQVKAIPEALGAFERHTERRAERQERSIQATRERLDSVVGEIRSAFERRQEDLVGELRRERADHDRRVDELVKKSAGATRLVVFLIVVVIVALLLVARAVA